MLATLQFFKSGLEAYLTRTSRARACEILLASSDRTLADTGFSRELLEQGVDAWPWQNDVAGQSELPALRLQLMNQEKAIRELQKYSDKELGDLGISRGSIVNAVKHGRTGIEQDAHREAA